LKYFSIRSIDPSEKDEWRNLAMRGAPFTHNEKVGLLDYCQTDVDALALLLPRMVPYFNFQQAQLRERYTRAVALMNYYGVPLDMEAFTRVSEAWDDIRYRLIDEIDKHYGVYVDHKFKMKLFEQYIVRSGIPWARTEKGALVTEKDLFRDMAKAYPQLAPLQELRASEGQMRLKDLSVGSDGRNHADLWMFGAKTGRNKPSSTGFIFGHATWMRSFIKAKPGWGIAYIDFSQQEFGIAAALSGDMAMMDAYNSEDPYLAFGKQAGLIPPEGTKATHKFERGLCKQCVLATQYGMGAESLARRIDQDKAVARALLRKHRETYATFWKWYQQKVDRAILSQTIETCFGWRLHLGNDAKTTAIGNFPMQANGAEMLRLACCYLTEAGIRVCAPIHDAILLEAPSHLLDAHVALAQELMAKASRDILHGFTVRTDAEIFAYSKRYQDERGVKMWNTVWKVLDDPRYYLE